MMRLIGILRLTSAAPNSRCAPHLPRAITYAPIAEQGRAFPRPIAAPGESHAFGHSAGRRPSSSIRAHRGLGYYGLSTTRSQGDRSAQHVFECGRPFNRQPAIATVDRLLSAGPRSTDARNPRSSFQQPQQHHLQRRGLDHERELISRTGSKNVGRAVEHYALAAIVTTAIVGTASVFRLRSCEMYEPIEQRFDVVPICHIP